MRAGKRRSLHSRTRVLALLALVALAGCGGLGPADPSRATDGDAGVPGTVDAADAPDRADVPAVGADTQPPDTRPVDGVAKVYPTSCDDIGAAPVIPPACATVLAGKTVTPGEATADSDESALDTRAIQAAIDACPAGQSVQLAADGTHNAFLVGAVQLKTGVTVWIDAGVTVYASRNPRSFDAKAGSGLCGTATSNGACAGVFNFTGKSDAGLMGAGTIDGQGGKPVLGGTSTWWQLNAAADGGLAAPRLVSANMANGLTIAGLRFQNAGKFHIVPTGSHGFTIWGITIITDPSSPNTDGIDPDGSTDGVIAYCTISTGDDNIAIKGDGPMVVDNLVIAHNHFGRGHGMSIGSETNVGVRNVKVCDLSLDGTKYGIRIKSDVSRGGLVKGIRYTDVCMRNVAQPLVFNPFYTSGATGTLIPDFQDITLTNVHVQGGGSLRLSGYDAGHPLTLTMDNVVFDATPTINASNAAITLGPNPVNILPSGTGVTVTDQVTGAAAPRDCSNVWVPFI
jgi:polygalacturonase